MAITHHIQKLRAKPEHIRERIALGTSAGLTGIVALVWIVTLATTGTFSLKSQNATGGDLFAMGDQSQTQNVAAQTQNGFSQLVGAAGAALGATSTAPDLHIVNDRTTSSLEAKQEAAAANNSNATVIPF
jgi:hypothetical protein